MVHAELARVAPAVARGLAEDSLAAVVVATRVEAEVVRPFAVGPVVAKAGESTGLLAYVALGVAALRAEREELHQLPCVVLVRRVLVVLVPGKPEQHRGIARHGEDELLEGAEEARAEELVLIEHQPLRADAVVGGREPVVPDERHALDERPARAHHAVEPPEVVVTPRVIGRERALVVVHGSGADEALARRARQRTDGALKAELRESFSLTWARPEAGTPEQPLGLSGPECAPIDGDSGNTARTRHDP